MLMLAKPIIVFTHLIFIEFVWRECSIHPFRSERMRSFVMHWVCSQPICTISLEFSLKHNGNTINYDFVTP